MSKENISYKHNYDVIFKWITSVFTGETLDVLGIKTGKIIEVRGLEPVTLQVKEERVDILLKDENDCYYHIEEERNFNRQDLYRFAAQHFLVAEQIKSNKLTTIIIISGAVTPLIDIKADCGSFCPPIINLNDRDGEAKLEQIRQQEKPNPIELVFLPMYGTNKKNKEDFAREVILFAKELFHKKRLGLEFLGALVILCNKMIPLNILQSIWEEIQMLQVFKDAEKIAKKEVAVEMLKKDMEISLIAELTKFSVEEIEEFQKELEQNQK